MTLLQNPEFQFLHMVVFQRAMSFGVVGCADNVAASSADGGASAAAGGASSLSCKAAMASSTQAFCTLP